MKMFKVSWFPELLPEEKLIEEKIINIIKKNYQQIWYTPIETPAVERNSVLTAKWGDEVSKQIFWLYGLAQWCEDKKDYSLHFDLTVPFARFIIDHKNELTFPFKRSQIQKVRRWERAQKWRFREFYQADIDVIWESEKNFEFYDAEIVFTINKTLQNIFSELKINETFTIKLNNKKIISWFLKWINLDEKILEITTIIDKKDKISQEEFINLLKKERLTPNQINQITDFTKATIDKITPLNEEMGKWINELQNLLNNLQNLWVSNIQVDFWIVRWLDYYTGMVFETFIDNNRKLGSIASGWKYENFTKFIDNKFSFSGVWGSIWISRLESFIFEKLESNKKTTTEYLIINFPETKKESLNLLISLLNQGKQVEYYPNNDKLKKQFKYADKKWIKYCIILGENELKEWYYLQKNMITWEQEKIYLK